MWLRTAAGKLTHSGYYIDAGNSYKNLDTKLILVAYTSYHIDHGNSYNIFDTIQMLLTVTTFWILY